MERLSNRLPAGRAGPGYARDASGVGQVHIGLGAFHRAHQALFTEEVLRASSGHWRIAGASLRSAAAAGELIPQDTLYTLVERGPHAQPPRVIGALAEVLNATDADGYRALIARIADPAVTVVTLTVTEKGYCQQAGALDTAHADVVHDLETDGRRRSLPGVLTAGLAARAAANAGPINVISCDNLSGNGVVTAAVVQAFAAHKDAATADWIAANVAFPNTMVDRIVPALDVQQRQALAETLGYRDDAVVVCEPFKQWVIEDSLIAARPAWETAGAQLVAEVAPFEAAKLSLLNGTHSAAAYLGRMLSYDYIHEVIADDACRRFLQQMIYTDVVPTVSAPVAFDVDAYVEQVLLRFSNPDIPYTTVQVATDGTQKLRERWLPALKRQLAGGRMPSHLTRAVALWIAHFADPAPDPRQAQLLEIASTPLEQQVSLTLDLPTFSGLTNANAFKDAVVGHLRALHASGVRDLISQSDTSRGT